MTVTVTFVVTPAPDHPPVVKSNELVTLEPTPVVVLTETSSGGVDAPASLPAIAFPNP